MATTRGGKSPSEIQKERDERKARTGTIQRAGTITSKRTGEVSRSKSGNKDIQKRRVEDRQRQRREELAEEERKFKESKSSKKKTTTSNKATTTIQPTSQLRPSERVTVGLDPEPKTNILQDLARTGRDVISSQLRAVREGFAKDLFVTIGIGPTPPSLKGFETTSPAAIPGNLLGKAAIGSFIKSITKGKNPFKVGKSARTSLDSLSNVGKGAVSRIKTNTKTLKTTKSILKAAGFSIAATGIIATLAGTYPFANFEIAEAMDKLGFARSRAIDANDLEAVDSLNQLQEEILNPEGWDKIISGIPFANVQRATTKNIEAAVASTQVFNKILQDKQIQQENGESDDDKWARVRQEQLDQEKFMINFYNEERKKLIRWEQEAAREQRIEEARFWANEREKQRKLEAEDRKAIAEFWEAYRKKSQQIADNNRPSNLNFGLL